MHFSSLATDRDTTLKHAEELLRAGQLDAAITAVEAAADRFVDAGAFGEAAALLRECASWAPSHVPILLRLVEVCMDGGLEDEMFDAQGRLADAYLLGGQALEARQIAEDLLARDPSDTRHAARLERARGMLGVPPTPAAVPSAPAREPVTVEIDLTAVLGELQAASAAPPAPVPTPRSLETVFESLRVEAALGDESDDGEEHLALARTYLELGLTAEAASSLEMAARSPRHRFVAAAMLAQVHRDNSDLARAIEWFERAAEAPAPTADDGRSLLYDLGDVLETVGEHARALAVFLELQTDDPGYRNVRERVKRLSKVETEG